jgi:general secretion pathway protein G
METFPRAARTRTSAAGTGRLRRFKVGSPCDPTSQRWLGGPPTRTAPARRLGGEGGYTFIELIVVTTILMILASAVLPLAQVTSQRQKEAELRRSLREMRTAIDRFKNAVDTGQIPTTELEPGNEGYPPELETLVEGVSAANDASGRKLKFLRRIPVDPMTNDTEWGLRSYQDDADSSSWGGQNVFDVYTKAGGTGLDGTKYRNW